jgi:gamma-glutamyltranspeptidase / glutathione hydrolase
VRRAPVSCEDRKVHAPDIDGGCKARVVVAAPNRLAAQAGARVGAEGGSAVDAALAAMLVTFVTEPGVVSIGGGAFVTVAPPGSDAVTVDGYVEMPGRGLPPSAFRHGTRDIVSDYAGGTTMTVGHGSVGTPGALPAFEEAHSRFGHVPWRVLVEPAIELARDGFPLGTAANYYLGYLGHELLAEDGEAFGAVHHPDGTVLGVGERVVIPHLADFLERVAAEGAAALFRGDVARALVEDMAAHGGIVTQADLDAFTPVVRLAAPVQVCDWTIATNPPPAIGGPVLAAMLILLDGHPADKWSDDDLERWIAVQRAVLRHRAAELDVTSDRARAGQALLDGVVAGGQKWLGVAPSTAHVSVVDVEGFACSVTASSGYGAGVTIPGTGVWLNNCLGEHELNRGGLHTLAPGERLASNMAPSVARRPDGAVLAIGSPGADRITTALAQVIASFAHGGYDLQDAIDRPRVHLSRAPDGTEILHHEEDIVLPASIKLPIKKYPAKAMFMGGVAAALREADGVLVGAADPRRTGAVALG